MAHSDTYNQQVAPSPNRTIGCQDLLKDGSCIHSGWLRRQSLRNKLKIFAWPQVYVVISGGCVYCYSNETARRPASAFSLYGYDRVFRAGEVTEREATWTFKLVHADSAYRSYLFSASSEKEMGYWMGLFKQEMLRANGKLSRTQGDGGNFETPVYQDAGSESAGSLTSQDYMEIEANIYEDSRQFVLPKNYTNKREEEDSDDEMDRVVITRPDLQERPPQPPPVPLRPGKRNRQTASQEAAVVNELQTLKVGSKFYQTPSNNTPVETVQSSEQLTPDRSSKPIRKRGAPDGSSIKKEEEKEKEDQAADFWTTIFFYGGKENASEIIRQIPDDGVFLVRVNDDKSMVLHVYANQQARKFQIVQVGKKYTLKRDSGDHFNRVEELIYFYYTNPLPNLDVCLSECYLQHPDYQKVHLP